MCNCVPCDFCDGGGEIATGTCGRCDGDGKLTLCNECIDKTVRLTPAEVAILREPAHGQLQVPLQPDSGVSEADFMACDGRRLRDILAKCYRFIEPLNHLHRGDERLYASEIWDALNDRGPHCGACGGTGQRREEGKR